MRSFDLTRAAKADLKAIATYTRDRWGVRQRNAYLREIDRVFHALAANPAMGQACEEILPGYRKFPHGPHVIYYREIGVEELLVVRILHGAMDVTVQLGSKSS